jgi:hypothetical protein
LPEGEVSRTGKVLFRPGNVVATPGAIEAINASGDSPFELLMRHLTGDWGDLAEHDRRENELSVQHHSRILSCYRLSHGTRIWLITEADRSSTDIPCRSRSRLAPGFGAVPHVA